MLIDVNPESFEQLIVSYLKNTIEDLSKVDDEDKGIFEEGEKEKLIESLKTTHDWFCLPSQWYNK